MTKVLPVDTVTWAAYPRAMFIAYVILHQQVFDLSVDNVQLTLPLVQPPAAELKILVAEAVFPPVAMLFPWKSRDNPSQNMSCWVLVIKALVTVFEPIA